jgi:hypothetical protein
MDHQFIICSCGWWVIQSVGLFSVLFPARRKFRWQVLGPERPTVLSNPAAFTPVYSVYKASPRPVVASHSHRRASRSGETLVLPLPLDTANSLSKRLPRRDV